MDKKSHMQMLREMAVVSQKISIKEHDGDWEVRSPWVEDGTGETFEKAIQNAYREHMKEKEGIVVLLPRESTN